MSKKKSKRKIDLKTAILVLLLLAALLFATTYAWFTANRVVSISDIDVHIEAQSGLQISADGENWKSVLTVDDLKAGYVGNTNQIPDTMEPVSTIGEVDPGTGFMKMFYGTVDPKDNGFALTAEAEPAEEAGDEGRFVAFDIFLQVNQDEPNVILGKNSTVTFKGSSGNTGLQNAARVALIKQTHAETGALPTTFITNHDLAKSFLEASQDSTELWEPNSDVHTSAAVAAAKSNYEITTQETGADVIPYYGINQPIETGVDLKDTNDGTDSTHFTSVTPSIITNEAMADYENAFSLTKGITKIRIYMWVEGQDVDCENNASGSDISFKLEFKVPEPVTPTA